MAHGFPAVAALARSLRVERALLFAAVHCIRGTAAWRNGAKEAGHWAWLQPMPRQIGGNQSAPYALGEDGLIPSLDTWPMQEEVQVRLMDLPPPAGLPRVDHSLLHGGGSWLPSSARDMLLNIGSGTGATPGTTGDLVLDQDLVRRMRFQDKVVMLLLLMAYMGSLAFSASLAYRQSVNSSPVTYYADPRFHTQVMEGHDLEDFLEVFNQPPKDVQLQITGFLPITLVPETFMDSSVDWLGSRYRVAFSFALDLSPWVVHDSGPAAAGANGSGFAAGEGAAGVSPEDLEGLRDFLERDCNDLAAVELRKEVCWPEWEELATNIKHQIRQSGFSGIISVRCSEDEIMMVYKNKTWANFMHRRTTKVLCALSIIGWLIYQPYMWLRHQAVVVTSQYRVDVGISSYWPLIADKVGPEGFSSG